MYSAMKPLSKNFSDMTISAGTLHRNSLPIPDELIVDIFTRLSSESIARCRCVCKRWSSILVRQDFTESFLTKSSACPQILFACDACTGIFFFSSAQPKNPKENSYVVASNLLARFSISEELCGCTNGFFLYVSKIILIDNEMQIYVTLVCNPSTGQYLCLPKLKSRKSFGVVSYLGYEPIANELKVFSMEWSNVISCVAISMEHQVLSIETEEWSSRCVQCCIPHHPSCKWICINGVIYYASSSHIYSLISMVACFDLRSEKLSFVKFMETFNGAMQLSTKMVNYNGKLGLLMSRESGFVTQDNASIELWVLLDPAKHEWSKHVYLLPPLWKDVVVTETMCISGMVR